MSGITMFVHDELKRSANVYWQRAQRVSQLLHILEDLCEIGLHRLRSAVLYLSGRQPNILASPEKKKYFENRCYNTKRSI